MANPDYEFPPDLVGTIMDTLDQLQTPINHNDQEVIAESVLMAIRDCPTPAMLHAAVKFAMGVSLGGDYNWHQYMSDLWRVFVDAAVAEHDPTLLQNRLRR